MSKSRFSYKAPYVYFANKRLFTVTLVALGLSSIFLMLRASSSEGSVQPMSMQSLSEENHSWTSSTSPLELVKDRKAFLKLSLKEKCEYYFDMLYRIDPAWTNDNSLGEQYLERLRVYDVCFINARRPDGNTELDLFDFGSMTHNYREFESKMFPFLNANSSVLPTVTDLHGNIEHPWKEVSNLDFSKHSYWYNFEKRCKGQGIVLSIGDGHAEYTAKLFNTLDFLNNTLPIQIVHQGDLGKKAIKFLADHVPKSQKVSVVDVSPVMSNKWHVGGFMNKWFALIFSSFEEVLFMDADVISFIPPVDYFEGEYKGAFYKDRYMPNQKVNRERCRNLFESLAATEFELDAFASNHNIHREYRRNYDYAEVFRKKSTKTLEEQVLQDFFLDGIRHIAETGLFTLSKKKDRIMSTVGSFMMHKTLEEFDCSHGDKEYMWHGPLALNYKFKFVPGEASLAGSLEDNQKSKETKICGIQIAHLAPHMPGDPLTLQWINGGMEICKKGSECSERDFESEDFTILEDGVWKKPESVEYLRNYYSKAIKIEGVVEPNPRNLGSWDDHYSSCLGYQHCIDVNGEEGKRFFKFSDEVTQNINDIAARWIQKVGTLEKDN